MVDCRSILYIFYNARVKYVIKYTHSDPLNSRGKKENIVYDRRKTQMCMATLYDIIILCYLYRVIYIYVVHTPYSKMNSQFSMMIRKKKQIIGFHFIYVPTIKNNNLNR